MSEELNNFFQNATKTLIINENSYIVEYNFRLYNYADDTTFYACGSDLHNLILRLEHDFILAIEWFECNYMKLNQDKCHLLILGHKYETCGQVLVLAKFRKLMIKNLFESTLISI